MIIPMKQGILFLFFTTTVLSLPAQQKKVSVLFIGNSYTYSNDLPLMLDSMAAAAGDTLEWDISAPGGYSLKQHSTDSNTLNKIRQQPWDYVVLQEQSQLPSLHPDSVDSTTIPYALFLDSIIRANHSCTQVVFYETWGRKYGDAANCAAYPPVCTYDGMQLRLKDSYKRMADTCRGIMAPVGDAFRKCIEYDSTVNLYQADFSHPSLEGSFLAACVFYNIFFHRSPHGNAYDPGITQLQPYLLRLLANYAVEDSLNFYNLGIYEPWAKFTWHEAPGCVGVFNGLSNSNFTHIWDFGDSTTSADPNPVHQYPYSRYYPVWHVVHDACKRDSFFLTNNMVCNVAFVSENTEDLPELYPNPVTETLYVIGYPSPADPHVEVSIFNALGELIFNAQPVTSSGKTEIRLDVRPLAPGIYFARIATGGGIVATRKFSIAR